jgi:DNA-binding CsgD family transcriptional regulator
VSALELARKHSIHRHTVTKHLKREDISIRGSQAEMTPDAIAKAAQLYTSGQSLAQIGAHLGVDPSAVSATVTRAS